MFAKNVSALEIQIFSLFFNINYAGKIALFERSLDNIIVKYLKHVSMSS